MVVNKQTSNHGWLDKLSNSNVQNDLIFYFAFIQLCYYKQAYLDTIHAILISDINNNKEKFNKWVKKLIIFLFSLTSGKRDTK